MEGEFVAPSVSPPYNQKKGGFMSKITSLRCLNLSEGGCRAQLNRVALTTRAETLLKMGVALSEGVFIAGLGVPSLNAAPLRHATGGGGLLRIRNLRDGACRGGWGGMRGRHPLLAQPVPPCTPYPLAQPVP